MSLDAEPKVVMGFVQAIAGLQQLRNLSLPRMPLGSAVMHLAHATQLTQLHVVHYAYEACTSRADHSEHMLALRAGLPKGCDIWLDTNCYDY